MKLFATIKVPLGGERVEVADHLPREARASEHYQQVREKVQAVLADHLLEKLRTAIRFESIPSREGGEQVIAYVILAPEHNDFEGMSFEVTNN